MSETSDFPGAFSGHTWSLILVAAVGVVPGRVVSAVSGLRFGLKPVAGLPSALASPRLHSSKVGLRMTAYWQRGA